MSLKKHIVQEDMKESTTNPLPCLILDAHHLIVAHGHGPADVPDHPDEPGDAANHPLGQRHRPPAAQPDGHVSGTHPDPPSTAAAHSVTPAAATGDDKEQGAPANLAETLDFAGLQFRNGNGG